MSVYSRIELLLNVLDSLCRPDILPFMIIAGNGNRWSLLIASLIVDALIAADVEVPFQSVPCPENARPPSGEEKEIALAALNNDRVAGAENLQWALLNSVEFFFHY